MVQTFTARMPLLTMCIWIRQKTLELSSTVLSTLSSYIEIFSCVNVQVNHQMANFHLTHSKVLYALVSNTFVTRRSGTNHVHAWSSEQYNNNNNSHDNVYGVVIMTRSRCESSPGSSDKCRLSDGGPPTLRPSQSTWAVSPPKIGSYRPHPPSPLLLLLSP